ncbi:hypothetical protein JR316_0008249 [Psilocybe cubensis]|uniref:Uncharacterized protein n=2 Tax=Psilocybe cubensis TaxID=181762 RepID=A0ACB8GW09_PSICU|nr:hypothetical protein JR316_0008249 [Psilocybe cubensis]KAH9479654.1 hypothetical protein JR316_0008249 [Psilocybe cubensis]
MASSLTLRVARRIPSLLNVSFKASTPSIHPLCRKITFTSSPFTQNGVVGKLQTSKRWASSVTPQSSASDPAEAEALRCLEQGTAKLEDGDVQGAKELYLRSCEIHRNASSLFNLGVTHFHLKEYDDAIAAWKESISMQPSSADAHTNLASAYLLTTGKRDRSCLGRTLPYIIWSNSNIITEMYTRLKKILHRIASSLSPEDAEIAFNHAAVLEASNRLEEALEKYKLAEQFGVSRAVIHIRNISAKILMQRTASSEKVDG